MKLIQVGAAVLNQTPLDWNGNQRRIVEVLRAAREQGVSILCLPELCICGYGCEDAFHGAYVQATAAQVLQDLLPETRGMIVSIGLPVLYRNAVFNTAAIVVDGQIAGFVAKRYLAGDGIHYEPRWFKPWPLGVQGTLEIGSATYPIGDLYFKCGGVKFGLEICEDAWVATRPGAELARRGVDLILNPSASHFAFGKFEVRQRFVLEGSRAFGVSYLYANLLGNEAGRAIYDGGALIAAGGKLLAAGPRFSFADWGLTTAQIDIDHTRMSQARTGSFQHTFDQDESNCVVRPFAFPDLAPQIQPQALAPWEASKFHKEEEFARAVSLALFDYLRKSKSNGFVVSLSGGADSAAVSTLIWLLVQFGLKELGWKNLVSKLPAAGRFSALSTSAEMVKELLTCVYQGTENSSAVTRNAARNVAVAIGAEFWEFEVGKLVQDYIQMVAQSFGRPLDWKTDDVALQNIQARVRGPGVWLTTNLKNALLLSTSNRSEAAVGYATMDGDTCGGLSPIAGIDKAFLRRWLRWMEEHGPVGFSSLPALSAVNVQAPTAELRPLENKQTDEDDLMPYPLLDAIEKAAIRDKQSPQEVFALMQAQFPEYYDQQLVTWVDRFFRLWCRNQWKRERYAPSFHVDDENLDPKTWCRFPILSGGFERELAELRKSHGG